MLIRTLVRNVSVFLFLSGAYLCAQFTPVMARVNQEVHILKDGKQIQSHNRSGYFYRSTDGSELYHWDTEDGKAIARGTLKDNITGMHYQLDFVNHKAVEAHKGRPTPPGLLQEAKAGDRPRDSVEGISCVVYSPKTEKACWSIEYFLPLWDDLTLQNKQNQTTYQTVSRMSGIKLNAQVDPNLFDVHKNFQVYAPETTQP